MNSFPNQTQIVDAVLLGIKTAKQNFTYWTVDELSLSYAPPKFLSIHVSQEIAKIENSPEIFIDATVVDILKCSLSHKESFREVMKNNMLAQSKMSLTLDERFEHKNDDDSVSRVIITLKNGVRNAKDEYKKDVETLCKMLQRKNRDDSSLDYALFAFSLEISSNARIRADKRVEEIISMFDEVVSSYKNLQSSFKGGDITTVNNIGEWCVGCYIIEPII